MANSQGRVLPFRRRAGPIPSTCYPFQPDAELRAAVLNELLDGFTIRAEQRTGRLRIRLVTLAANALLEELVLLSSRASCQLHGGKTP